MPARYPRVSHPRVSWHRVSWILLGVVASTAWFAVSLRLMRAWGLHEAAPAIGLLTATAVAVTLWRWARSDREQAALAELRCPRCRSALRERHQHARPGGVAAGVQRWSCERCDYDHVEPLTCPGCAA